MPDCSLLAILPRIDAKPDPPDSGFPETATGGRSD